MDIFNINTGLTKTEYLSDITDYTANRLKKARQMYRNFLEGSKSDIQLDRKQFIQLYRIIQQQEEV